MNARNTRGLRQECLAARETDRETHDGRGNEERSVRGNSDPGEDKDMKVKDLMQTDIVTLQTNDTLDIAEDIMSLGRLRHLPVIQVGNRLVGMVSQRDLLRASLSSALNVSAYKRQQWLEKIAVRDVMSKGVVSVEADADIKDALDVLLGEKFGCLPVVEAKKLVGVLTETDLLEYLQRLLQEGKDKKKKSK